MIIKYEIDKKYANPEIHVCVDVQNRKAMEIYDALHEVFEQTINAYEGEERSIVPISGIIRIYSANKQVYIEVENKQLRVKERLYELEERLSQDRFVRISNSEIVNVRKIKRLDTSVTGTIRMKLAGDIETYVSRRYVTRIKQTLGI